MHWDGWWHMGWMWIFWIILLCGLVLLIRSIMAHSRGGQTLRESPEEILKRRYASGEIDREEYERKLSDLRR